MSTIINSFTDEYFFLSNFYECPINFDGLTYGSNEAAFQAQKCADAKGRVAFTTLNPTESKKLGREINLRKDWEEVKIGLMEQIVAAKFSQHPDLMQKLLNTGDAYLEEGNTWGDRVWGTVNGSGANNLGRILMGVRQRAREERMQST